MNINRQPTLIGPSMRLEPMKDSDFDSLFAAASDPLIWEQHPDPLRYQKDVFKKYFDSGMASEGGLIIRDLKTGEVAGASRYYDYNPQNNSIIIGYTFIARKYWGGSFNRELKDLMIKHAFTFVDSAIFVVGEHNLRSQKAMTKIGGKFIGQKPTTGGIGKPQISFQYEIRKANFEGPI